MDWVLFLGLLWQQGNSTGAASESTNKAAVSPVAAAPADVDSDAWVQEARDWLVAVRVANEKMTPAQTEALSKSFERLAPAALRVLTTVYEHTYGVQSPLSAADRRPPDATEAEREWIMAYRILYDQLSVADAKAYAETLRAMNPNQIRALLEIYQEKNRQQNARQTAGTASPGGAAPTTSPGQPRSAEDEAAARRALEVAQSRMEFEEMRRNMALGRASIARSDTKHALEAANASAAVTAAAMNQRLRDQEAISNVQAMQHNAFQNRMYERSGYSTNNGPYLYRIY